MNTPTHKQTLTALMALAEDGRMGRSEDRPCKTAEWTGTAWKGSCDGEGGRVHRAVITVTGKRSFRCSCPDHARLRGRKGPCKHVISLAKVGFAHIGMMDLVLAGQGAQA